MIENAFLKVLEMTTTASYVILFIWVIRFFLKRSPKIFSYAMWAIVFIRLICPVTWSSIYSVVTVDYTWVTKQVEENILEQSNQLEKKNLYTENKNQKVPMVQNNKESVRPKIQQSNSLLAIGITIASMIWFFGFIILFLFYCSIYIRLKLRLTEAWEIENGVYESNVIKTPFVYGILKPRIYLPASLSIEEREYILEHEKVHIRRCDHIIKMLASGVLCMHWFNPFVWISYKMMTKDMEMSCDEQVIKKMGDEIKLKYSTSLLNMASKQSFLINGPLAFGEKEVKGRIKNILQYKKPAIWLICSCSIVFIISLFVLLSDPKEKESISELDSTQKQLEEEEEKKKENLEEEILKMNTAEETIIPTQAVWTPETFIGVDGVSLDYGDENQIIFHMNIGLFVYDLKNAELMRAVDLETIGCHMTQGDGYCEVKVTNDGTLVYLHPYDQEYLYIYDISEDRIIKKLFIQEEYDSVQKFDNWIEAQEAAFEELEDSFQGIYGIQYKTKEGKEQQGFLFSPNELVEELQFRVNDRTYVNILSESSKVFYHEKEEEYQETRNQGLQHHEDSFYTELLESITTGDDVLHLYVKMLGSWDYAGVCSLSAGIEYSDEIQEEWDTIKGSVIGSYEIIEKDYYIARLEISITEPGKSDFDRGLNVRYIRVEKQYTDQERWFVKGGLMRSYGEEYDDGESEAL